MHEWADHGTCSMLSSDDYFKLAINLKQMNSIAIILRVNGIAPDAKKTRTPKEIVNAIKMHTENKEPQLVCDTSNKYLLEVRICYDKSDKPKYHDCPTRSKCDVKGVYYLPAPK
jgi:ribonuclease I